MPIIEKENKRVNPARTLVVGFLVIIAAGTLLLCLPISSRARSFTSLFDCLFTATSATCVTGLTVADTYTHWSLFGQIVIALLVQVGGLGFVTLITFFNVAAGKKLGYRTLKNVAGELSENSFEGGRRILISIIKYSLIFELCGALIMMISFIPRYGAYGVWMSIFMSITAFCNAGFDLMGPYSGAYSSFTAYAGDPLVSLTICALILFGGTGFLVWEDLVHNKYHWRRYRLQTKVVLTVNLVLTLGGGALFFLLERNNLGAGRPLGEQVLSALFDAVTPRTAGFNSTDTGALTSGSLLLTIIFMFIGGSPGSTAGGVKTTTVFVILLHALSGVRRERSANAFGRSIGDDALKKATAVLYTNLLLALTGAVAICAIQPLGLTEVLFETFSAIGTAGMTMGITRDLLPLSRLIIIFLMYCGRVGSISFAVALLEKRALPPVTLPREDITIG